MPLIDLASIDGVCPLRKEEILLDWMPLISDLTSAAERKGSSPLVSKTRPDHGTRARFTSGPSITLVPLSFCSLPIAAPHSSISDGDQAMATVS